MANDLIVGQFLGSVPGGAQPAPEPTAAPWVRQADRVAALERDYQAAVQRGDAQSAQYLAAAIRQEKQTVTPDIAAVAQANQRAEAMAGRKPRPGEEARLQTELQSIEKQAAKLQERKGRELQKLEAGPDQAAFDAISSLDRELEQCSYRQQAIQAALQSFERFRKDEASRKRQEAELERRRKHEAEIRRKAKELHAMIERTGEAWKGLTADLVKIVELAQSIAGEPHANRISMNTVSGLLSQATSGAVSFTERPKGITVSSTLPWPRDRR